MENLNHFFESFTNRVGQIVPGLAGAIVVLLVGWLIAWLIKKVILSLFKKTKLDEKLGMKIDAGFRLDKFIANVAYYVILVYVLLLVLGMMGVEGALAPVASMLDEFLGFLPNLVAATIIGVAGYIIAKLAAEATGLLTKSIEKISSKAGLSKDFNLHKIVKQLVFILVFFPILITAIDTLGMKAISEPATEMFGQFLSAIPNILAAAVLLAIFYFVGKYLTTILSNLLASLGIDQFSKDLGVSRTLGEDRKISSIIGNVVFFFLMFGGTIAAVDKLDLPQFSEILNEVFEISGKIFLGLVLLFIGNYLSKMASNLFTENDLPSWVQSAVRYATFILFAAIGLHTMGVAQDIINLAFGLTLGAIAIAVAIAFGLGGRETAAKFLSEHTKKK